MPVSMSFPPPPTNRRDFGTAFRNDAASQVIPAATNVAGDAIAAFLKLHEGNAQREFAAKQADAEREQAMQMSSLDAANRARAQRDVVGEQGLWDQAGIMERGRQQGLAAEGARRGQQELLELQWKLRPRGSGGDPLLRALLAHGADTPEAQAMLRKHLGEKYGLTDEDLNKYLPPERSALDKVGEFFGLGKRPELSPATRSNKFGIPATAKEGVAESVASNTEKRVDVQREAIAQRDRDLDFKIQNEAARRGVQLAGQDVALVRAAMSKAGNVMGQFDPAVFDKALEAVKGARAGMSQPPKTGGNSKPDL